MNYILILGPTASGKTSLAIELAKKNDAHIINMDSMQVYKEIPILSAAPSEAEKEDVPHHLFGHVPASHSYSTGEYLREVQEKLKELRGEKIIFVGGTGLYAHSMTEGMVETPPVAPEIRSAVRRFVDDECREAYKKLQSVDKESAKAIKPNDGVRISRALEVFEATGKPISEWHKEPQPPILQKGTWQGIGLMPPREAVYEKIAQRFNAMIDNGGIDEVARLIVQNLDDNLPVMKALGVPSLKKFYQEELEMEEAISRAITETRQYAKRQYTWLRNRAANWPKIEEIDENLRMKKVLDLIINK